MSFLVQHLWPALAAAFALGLAAGSFGVAGTAMSRSGRARSWLAALALAAVTGAAALQLAPGEAGLWLDGGVLLALAYAVGCVTATISRRLFARGASAEAATAGAGPPAPLR